MLQKLRLPAEIDVRVKMTENRKLAEEVTCIEIYRVMCSWLLTKHQVLARLV